MRRSAVILLFAGGITSFSGLVPFLVPAEQLLCEHVALYGECPVSASFGSLEASRAFVSACQVVLHSSDPDLQARLGSLVRSSKILSLLEGHYDVAGLPDFAAGAKTTCGRAAADRLKTESELGREAAEYLRHGIRPLMERVIDVSEIRAAFGRGEVARFDATRLLPLRMFNVTLEDLSAQEGQDLAGRTAVYENEAPLGPCVSQVRQINNLVRRFGPLTLQAEFAKRFAYARAMGGCREVPSLVDLGQASRGFHEDDIPFSAVMPFNDSVKGMFAELNGQHKATAIANINLRRLLSFRRGVDLVKLLSMSEQSEFAHSLLWIGTSGSGGYHYDAQDNVIMQLTHAAEVLTFPPNCSRYILDRGLEHGTALIPWLTEGLPWGEARIPFFHVLLEAGQGLVVPSMAYHRVLSRNPGSLRLNTFFEPRYGKVWGSSAPMHYYKHTEPDRLLVRHLFLGSLRRFWDEPRVRRGAAPLVMHTGSMEFM